MHETCCNDILESSFLGDDTYVATVRFGHHILHFELLSQMNLVCVCSALSPSIQAMPVTHLQIDFWHISILPSDGMTPPPPPPPPRGGG
jgi:hypothetical protein